MPAVITSAQLAEHAAQDAIDTANAHLWALAMTVAEKVSEGSPILVAVADVASGANESFDTVFAAVARFARSAA